MKKLKILVCEDNKQIMESYSLFFANKNTDIKFCEKDGKLLIDMIELYRPQVVITEMFLAHFDGIFVIEQIKKTDFSPQIFFATCATDNENVISMAMNSGFDFYFIKPYSLENLYSKMMFILNHCSENPHRRKIVELLYNIGMPVHLKGHKCIIDAVELLIRNPEYMSGITTVLYPKIGELNNTTAQRCERAIRTAIESTWIKGNSDYLEMLFPYQVKNYIKPSNSEFLAIITEYILINSNTNKKLK